MYNHLEIEKKWQKYWEDNNVFRTSNTSLKPKYYCLDMFPYPSGAGLHVGHPEGMTANDIVARYKKTKGHNVLHPMGWDAFGLPAENYAIKTGTHPRITTDENISNFKRQIKSLGFSYDWEREIDTTDPEYFKWTQWIFLKLFEKGLAYEQNLPINYCPSCKTGLANEEVLSDFSCERCGTIVEKKKIRQWVLAITKYAERLLSDVDDLDWPEGIKDMQRNWIGKSEGCEFELKKSDDETKSIRVYTTRVDTVFGMTYAVIAPDHPDVGNFIMSEYKSECENYISSAARQSDQDRTADDKEKTGVPTGSFVINPYNGKEVPLWIADYVLGSYGTGAVMAVPAHDERDFEFAQKFNLDITQSIAENYVYKGVDAPRKGVETLQRQIVDIIIENEKGEILLQTENHANGIHTHFVGGGVETGQSELEAVAEEVREETGYTDFEITGAIDSSYKRILGYRSNKDKNQQCIGRAFHVTLKSDAQIPSEIDEGKHTITWVKKEEVASNITWDVHSKFWNIFYKGVKPDTGYGVLVNSGEYDGLTSESAKVSFTELAEKKGFGHKKTNYKLRDWLFSRQRYWGEPIPLVHCEKCGIVGEKEENLPILLPETDKFEPSGDGTSPLTQIPEFVNCECPTCGGPGKRETNTMPQWGGSCWYYLRFMDSKNPESLVGSEIEKYWGSVDSYVGGAEHAVLHLLYARFWHKFLYDIGVVSTSEPFHRLRNQGLILAHAFQRPKGGLVANDLVEEKDGKYFEIETGQELDRVVSKMSKSLKNVVNPDDIIQQYGADSLRLYEMYMADFKDTAPWDTTAIVGVRRFLDKVNNMFLEEIPKYASSDEEAMKTLHKAVKKIEQDIENYKFNTAIAQMMILINTGEPKDSTMNIEWKRTFVKLLHPFAPHIAEECWEKIVPERQEILKVYFATGNNGKIKRAQSIFDTLRSKITLEKVPEFIEVEETGSTPLECAMQKIEAYKEKDFSVPVMTADTAVYFTNQDFDPTKVRRAALEDAGKIESEISEEECAEIMLNFYKNIAVKAGGEIEFYYIDAFAVLFPNGEVKTYEYRREYVLTDQFAGDLNIHAPMRGLYYSKITGKRAHETTMEDYNKEFACQMEAFSELFNLLGNSLFFTSWPEYNEAMTIDSEVTIGVQVLGKLRGEIKISIDEDKDSVLAKAKLEESVAKWIEGKTLVKEIYVPGKIVNLVVR